MRYSAALFAALFAALALPVMAETLHAWREPDWQPGVALSPADALQRWLETHKSAHLLRMPVELTWTADGLTLHARIGDLPVRLEDGALGISLVDRLRGRCVDRCRLWLTGYWRGNGVLDLRHVGNATTATTTERAADK